MNKENIFSSIKAEKQKVSAIIDHELIKADKNTNVDKQKRQELIDIGKFINASGEDIKILDANFEIPDFLIEWDGVLFGLEHTEVIDIKKKDTFEKTQRLLKETEKSFLARYKDVKQQIIFSLKFEITKITKKEKRKLLRELITDCKDLNLEEKKIMNLAYPGYLTEEDIKSLAVELADLAFQAYTNKQEEISHDLINYISFYPSSKTSLSRVIAWGADTISDLLLAAIKEKETKIGRYIKNTNGLKQCLFLLIQGSNGYSDYAYFDDKILSNRTTPFDKVVAFNFFRNEFFILK